MRENRNLIFISYAREDREYAERLYMDLRKEELNAWIDTRCLPAGSNWKIEIPKKIKECKYFILLISKHSINKRGYVQKEIKEGLATLELIPRNQIFIIPVRLDNTDPIDVELSDLNWVNLLPDYYDGFARILSAIGDIKKEPLITAKRDGATHVEEIIDKGEVIKAPVAMIVGERSPVKYAPFRNASEFFEQIVGRLPDDSIFSDTAYSYYFKIDMQHKDIDFGDDLKKAYPDVIVLVLQHAFSEIETREKGFSVQLKFSGQPRVLAIPYDAILELTVPEANITMMRIEDNPYKPKLAFAQGSLVSRAL
jgi:hypothetical protein